MEFGAAWTEVLQFSTMISNKYQELQRSIVKQVVTFLKSPCIRPFEGVVFHNAASVTTFGHRHGISVLSLKHLEEVL